MGNIHKGAGPLSLGFTAREGGDRVGTGRYRAC